jgi:hypothetical protein
MANAHTAKYAPRLMGFAFTKLKITGGDQGGVNRLPHMGRCGLAIDEKDDFPAPLQRINPYTGCALAILDYPHSANLVKCYKNQAFFWTLFMFISAKLRDSGIEGLKDKINKLK